MSLPWLPRWLAPRRRPAVSAAAPAATQADPTAHADNTPDSPPWPEVLHQLGDELAATLEPAARVLSQLNRLEPSLLKHLTPVSESVEKARQLAQAAQQLARLNRDGAYRQQRTVLSLNDIAQAAVTGRQSWFSRRGALLRHGLAPARVYADAALLFTLIDELLQWAGAQSRDVAVQVDASASSGRARLRVSARHATEPALGSASGERAWTNTRWFLWHQIARTLGAQTELRTHPEHMTVQLVFPPVTDAQTMAAIEVRTDPSSVSAVIQGSRVLLISAQPDIRARAMQALAGFGVRVEPVASGAEALAWLEQHLPDAVVYDATLDEDDLTHLRHNLAQQPSTAYVEIHDDQMPTDFHTTTIGDVSTGHVSASGLQHALGPALVFEMCKVM